VGEQIFKRTVTSLY